MLLRLLAIMGLCLAALPTAVAGEFCDGRCVGGGVIFDFDNLCVAADYSVVGNHHSMFCTFNPLCPAPIPEYCMTDGYYPVGAGVELDDIDIEDP